MSLIPGMPDYRPGHAMHFIHANVVGRSPWGWRPGTVRRVDGQAATVDYVLEEGAVEVWRHAGFANLKPGTPVRVHEGLHALELTGAWLNVEVRSGIGPVPEPEHPELWAAETTRVVVTDLRTGTAVREVPREEP